MRAAPIPDVLIVREPSRALALLDPERRRLVDALHTAPDSASGLARRLGESRQRLNYHLRLLEDAKLVELAEVRRKGNCTERILRLVARRFLLDPASVGGLAAADPDEVGDRFSGNYLVALAARAIQELADLRDRAKTTRKRLATASINTTVRLATPAAFGALARDLTEAVAAVVARHHDRRGDGRWFRIVLGTYPGPRPRPHQETSDD